MQVSEEEVMVLVTIAAAAALDFARQHPEVMMEYPASYELVPHWIAALVLGRCE